MMGAKILLVMLSWSFLVGADENSTICYEPLGCFTKDGPWFTIPLRPFPLPERPDKIGTNIYYFNRKIQKDGVKVYDDLKIQMRNETNFETNLEETFFIVHGYMGSGNTSWMTMMKDAILGKMDANVFLVDWGKGASTINYPRAASNARVVGAELGRFISYLEKNFELDLSRVHLVGHSLGAHISSYAAKAVHGIGRVTGLDAAQPGFEGLPKEVRIDKSDANFVDLIHTNIRPTIPTVGFGLISAVGHVDIYVNGGLDQPGCYAPDGVNVLNLSEIYKIPFSVLANWVSCSHGKSHEYFTASLEAKCKTWARKSGKARNILNAVTLGNVEPITSAISKCSADTCTELGLATPKYEAHGVFAATTTRQYPYCDAESNPSYDKEIEKQIKTDQGEKHLASSILKKFII